MTNGESLGAAIAVTSPAPDELRARIVRVFQRMTGQSHKAAGALTWFAAKAGCSPVTVHRYVTGRSNPTASVEGVRALVRLRQLEIEAGIPDPVVVPDLGMSAMPSPSVVREGNGERVLGLDAALEILRVHGPELRRLGVRSLALYGSVARGRARADSDVDVLVELEPGVGLFGLQRLQRRLETLLGSSVDLSTLEMLHRRLRPRILAEAVRA